MRSRHTPISTQCQGLRLRCLNFSAEAGMAWEPHAASLKTQAGRRGGGEAGRQGGREAGRQAASKPVSQ